MGIMSPILGPSGAGAVAECILIVFTPPIARWAVPRSIIGLKAELLLTYFR